MPLHLHWCPANNLFGVMRPSYLSTPPYTDLCGHVANLRTESGIHACTRHAFRFRLSSQLQATPSQYSTKNVFSMLADPPRSGAWALPACANNTQTPRD